MKTILLLLVITLVSFAQPGLRRSSNPPVKQNPAPESDNQDVLYRIIKAEKFRDVHTKLWGTIQVRSLTTKKAVKFLVPPIEELSLTVGTHKIESDRYVEFLMKGLICQIEWRPDLSFNLSVPSKQITAIKMKTMKVGGVVLDAKPPDIKLRVTPLDEDWPHLIKASKEKPERLRRMIILKCKAMDETIVSDKDGQQDIAALTKGTVITAEIIIGIPHSILLTVNI